MPADTPITIASARRIGTPQNFADPERFDIERTPNRHLAFGSGMHHCAGMSLARIEACIAIARFLDRFPRF